MPFKDLEHDGSENFESLSNRIVAKAIELKAEQDLKLQEDKILEERQKEWLSPANPLLWDRLD